MKLTSTQKLLITLACGVVSHLAVGALGYAQGGLSGYRDGVIDGHLAVRRVVTAQTNGICEDQAISRECNAAIEIQYGLETTFQNAGNVYRDPYQGLEQYLVTPH